MSDLSVQVEALHQTVCEELKSRIGSMLRSRPSHYHLRKRGLIPALVAPSTVRSQQKRESTLKTRELVKGLLARGLSRAEISRRLGIAKSTVTYRAERLGEGVDVDS
jgi:DNA-binding NarL/FixJ family response regulator